MNELKAVATAKLVKARKAFLKANNALNVADEGGDLTEATTPLYVKMELAYADLIGVESLARQVGVFRV